MRVLLVGGSGFLGTLLGAELARRGDGVISTSRGELDVTDLDSCRAVLATEAFDVVVNLAASGVTPQAASTDEMSRVNGTGPVTLARAVAELPSTPRYVHSSSSTEPEPNQLPESVYSETKARGAAAALELLADAGVPTAVARIHNAYGSTQPSGRFVADAISTLRRGEPLVIRHPHRVRDFCLADDVVGLLADVVGSVGGSAEHFDIGTGIGTSLEAAAVAIALRLGVDPALVTGAAAGDVSAPPDPHPLVVADPLGAGFLRCATPFNVGIDTVVEATGGPRLAQRH